MKYITKWKFIEISATVILTLIIGALYLWWVGLLVSILVLAVIMNPKLKIFKYDASSSSLLGNKKPEQLRDKEDEWYYYYYRIHHGDTD